MKCNNCNNYIPDDSIFCPICGKKVSESLLKKLKRKLTDLKIVWSKIKNNLDFTKIMLAAIAVGVWILVLQNFGVFTIQVEVDNTVDVYVKNTVDVQGTVSVWDN